MRNIIRCYCSSPLSVDFPVFRWMKSCLLLVVPRSESTSEWCGIGFALVAFLSSKRFSRSDTSKMLETAMRRLQNPSSSLEKISSCWNLNEESRFDRTKAFKGDSWLVSNNDWRRGCWMCVAWGLRAETCRVTCRLSSHSFLWLICIQIVDFGQKQSSPGVSSHCTTCTPVHN